MRICVVGADCFIGIPLIKKFLKTDNQIVAVVKDNITGVSLSFIQVFGLYVIARILVGNSSSQYVSNFYSTKPLDLDAVSKKMEEIQKQYGDDFDVEDNRNEKRD